MPITRPFSYDADGLKLHGWAEITPGEEATHTEAGHLAIAEVTELTLEGYGPLLVDHLHPRYITNIERQVLDSFKRLG